jgi:hypothetical protein
MNGDAVLFANAHLHAQGMLINVQKILQMISSLHNNYIIFSSIFPHSSLLLILIDTFRLHSFTTVLI